MRRPFRFPKSNDRGVALFAAVWIALVITIFAVGVTRESRTATSIATYHLQASRAEAAARSGLVWLQSVLAAQSRGIRLSAAGPDRSRPSIPLNRQIRLDGTEYAWAYADADVRVRVEAEAGKLALNTAEPDVLRAVLSSLVPGEAEAVLNAVLSTRRQDHRTGKIAWRLQRPGFNRVDDLIGLKGISAKTFATLAPFLTVETSLRQPDPLLAQTPLFRALPLDDDTRRQLRTERALTRSLEPWPGRPMALTLRAQASLSDGTSATAAVLVKVNPGADPPVQIIRPLPAYPAPAD